MKYVLIGYSKCSTCRKAKKFLLDRSIDFEERDIKEQNPTYDELKLWYEKYHLSLKKLFNTSGLVYKEMNLKDKLSKMSEEEQLKLLSGNGMLVKRPILVGENLFLCGFKESLWMEKLEEI